MKYRVQKSDHLGFSDRWKKVKWSPWVTVEKFDTLEDAEPFYTYQSMGRGLRRFRVILGTRVILKSL